MAPPNDHRLVPVYPPYSIPPTSPPLGVSLLKGFIQRTLPDWSVKVLDLNLDMHDELFRRLAQGPCLPQKEFPEGLLGEIALSAPRRCFTANARTSSTGAATATRSSRTSGCA